MNIAVKGAKAGGGEQRRPVVAPDSAASKTFVKIQYGLSEGEIEGLVNGEQSIYLEDTPLKDASNNWNFQNVDVQFRHGTNDQDYMQGFPDVSAETGVNVELTDATPYVRAISNTDLDAVSIRLKWGPIRQTNPDNGDVNGYTIEYAIDLQTDGGAYVTVVNGKLSDKTSANYERQHRIDLPAANSGWQIRVRRLTPNSTSEYISDKMYVDAIVETVDVKLRYPNTAMLGLQYDAETFSNIAKIAVRCKGIKVRVPSNYNPVTRAYTGIWDGAFVRAYSNNPAWIYYDLCTGKRYGIGERLTDAMIDKWSLYRLAQYCDQMVDDGKGGQEPRFTCNVYLQSAEDAFAILSKLAGVFRAISYWDGNSIICDADIPQDTYFTYTRANVIDGSFEYTGTRARDRHTVAKVAWDNPDNRFKTEYEYVRDETAISKFGVKIAEIDAWGCTSRGQAQRAGLWALKSEQLESRTVTFKVGLDGYIPQPGKVIEVADELFAGRANGGRVSAISTDRTVITLDREVTVVAGDKLIINGENGLAQSRIIQSVSGRDVTVTIAFDADSIAPQNVWVIDAADLATMKFRVMSIVQNDKHQFTITALQYEPQKYDAIDAGAYVENRPISVVRPTTQDPVSSVTVTGESRVDQGINIASMIITWPQVSGAVKYQVEWRKDDGSWIKMPIATSNSAEVQGIYAGNYQARVTAINAFDVASLPTFSNLTALSGKIGLPPALATISATGTLFGMIVKWAFPATGAADTAYTEIQYATLSDYSDAALLGQFAYPTNTHQIQGLQGDLVQYYRGRLIDKIGNVGAWSAWTSGRTDASAAKVLDLLNGQITSTQLHQSLSTEISRIGENATAISTETQARTDADSALTTQINTVSAVAAAKNKTYRQAAAPASGMVAGDLWFDSDDNNKAYRYSGTSWDLTDDARISANAAAIQTEATARADADSALSSSISTVQTTVDGHTSSIQTQATSINGLSAQYTVKIDAGGKVAGFGLASTPVNGATVSDFILRADRFAIAPPSGSGEAANYAFVYQSTAQVINGVTVPAGLYLDSAYIKNGSITTAHIGNAQIDAAKIADAAITSAKIGDAQITNAKVSNGAIGSINIVDGAVTTAKIGDLQVDTLKIKDQAVTFAVAGQGVSALTITTNGGRVIILIGITCSLKRSTTATELQLYLQLRRNGEAINTMIFRSQTGDAVYDLILNIQQSLPAIMDTPAAGTYTYELFFDLRSSGEVGGVSYAEVPSTGTELVKSNISMILEETKK